MRAMADFNLPRRVMVQAARAGRRGVTWDLATQKSQDGSIRHGTRVPCPPRAPGPPPPHNRRQAPRGNDQARKKKSCAAVKTAARAKPAHPLARGNADATLGPARSKREPPLSPRTPRTPLWVSATSHARELERLIEGHDDQQFSSHDSARLARSHSEDLAFQLTQHQSSAAPARVSRTWSEDVEEQLAQLARKTTQETRAGQPHSGGIMMETRSHSRELEEMLEGLGSTI